jgi:transposase
MPPRIFKAKTRFLERNWPRYAKALDMKLGGKQYKEIAEYFGVSKQRAQQMVRDAKAILAYRVFYVPRPKSRSLQ